MTRKILEEIGFYQEGTELGDDGALEYKTKNYTIMWVPKKGRYTEDVALGWWISQNDEDLCIKIPLKNIKDIQILKILLTILK